MAMLTSVEFGSTYRTAFSPKKRTVKLDSSTKTLIGDENVSAIIILPLENRLIVRRSSESCITELP